MKLKFVLTHSSAPWYNPLSEYAATRLSVTCDSVVYVDEHDVETPAPFSTAIFVYAKSGDDWVFSHVASPVELLEVSEGADNLTKPDWLRQDYINLIFPCVTEADESLDKIRGAIRFLSKEIKAYRRVTGNFTEDIETTL